MKSLTFVRKISESILSILICLGLIFGPRLGWAESNFVQFSHTFENIALPVNLTSNVRPLVEVTSSSVDADVLVSVDNVASESNCQTPKTQSLILIQDQGIINLNQSAGCFSLSLGQAARQTITKVKPLARHSVIVVVKNGEVIHKVQKFHSESTNVLSVAPQFSLLVILLFFGWASRIKKYVLLRPSKHFKPIFKTLMVFRC